MEDEERARVQRGMRRGARRVSWEELTLQRWRLVRVLVEALEVRESVEWILPPESEAQEVLEDVEECLTRAVELLSAYPRRMLEWEDEEKR